MNIAYLILAHNNPIHLRRLITALSSNLSNFFIHIDKKSNDDDLLNIKGNNIHYTQERVPVFWGDFSTVEAILILLQTAFEDRGQFDRFVLLSGTDYPLRSALYIEQFFERYPKKEFMNFVAMPSPGKPIYRLNGYKLSSGGYRVSRFIRRVLRKVGVLPRKRDYKTYLGNLAPFGGSTWWALSREASDFILTFVKKETQVINFYRNTIIPDEGIFQTILVNSHFRSRIARNLTFADWSAGGSHPAYITEKHLSLFRSTSSFNGDDGYGGGEMLFARKFSDESEDLVARLENLIAKKEAGLKIAAPDISGCLTES